MLLAVIAGVSYLLWRLTGDWWLDHFFRWVRYGELWVINLFEHNKYGACLDWLRVARLKDYVPAPEIYGLTQACFTPEYLAQLPSEEAVSYYELTARPIAAIGAGVQVYYRWPLVVALAWVAIRKLFFAPNYNFMTKHTLESLIQTQAKMWPIISPIVKLNPSKKRLRKSNQKKSQSACHPSQRRKEVDARKRKLNNSTST